MKNLDRGVKLIKFSYTYSLFKGNYCIERNGIILLHKYKVEQTGVIVMLLSPLRHHEFGKYSLIQLYFESI